VPAHKSTTWQQSHDFATAHERHAERGIREFLTENNVCEVEVKRSLVPERTEFIFDQVVHSHV
jgi:hypothetical protein